MLNRHVMIDRRSLAMGQAIAAHVRQRPELVADAIERVRRWKKTTSPGGQTTLDEWLQVLSGPIDGVYEMLTAGTEQATRLRQSNPFAGVLPQAERNAILLRFESYDPAST